MRILIAISSCWDFEKNLNNAALRETWLPDTRHFPELDYKFFVGHGQGAESAELPNDCVFLPEVDDGYGFLTYKTQASLRWAAARNYDFVFRCFPDTYVRVDRLLACPFSDFDYYGDFRSEVPPEGVTLQGACDYASGGPGSMLSRKAFEQLLEAPILGIWRDDITRYAEDLWVGNRLGVAPVKLSYFDDKRFVNKGTGFWPNRDNETVTAHLSCPGPYDKVLMYRAHAVWDALPLLKSKR